jgi:hypothetical protein
VAARDPRRRRGRAAQGAERQAINAPMQGTAADLIKLAMIAVQGWLDREQLATADDHAGARRTGVRGARGRSSTGCAPRLPLTVARWPECREPVLLVAHQPALGHVIATLMGGQIDADTPAWTVRKGAVWWLRHRVRQGVPEVVLVSVNSPDRV